MVNLSAEAKTKIQATLLEAVESGKTPGLVFGATSAEKELFFTHAGSRVYGDPSAGPMTDDSVFWICSQTKMVVVIAFFQLVEQGKVQLDTPVADVLPELKDLLILDKSDMSFKPYEKGITIRHLINHTSGLAYRLGAKPDIPYALPLPYVATYGKENPIGEFYDKIKELCPAVPVKYEPGTDWSYGYSIDSLGFIVERVTGKNLNDYMRENIFDPLGMRSPTFYLTPEVKKRAVPLTFRENGVIKPWANQTPLTEQDPDKVTLRLGGIGLYSSLKDYLILLRHLLQIRVGTAKNPILKAETVNSFFEPTLGEVGSKSVSELMGGTNLNWSTALCMNMDDFPGRRKKGSAWWYGWAGTYHFMDPQTGVALVIGSQIVPSRDSELEKVWTKVEEIFYSGVQS